MIKTILVPTGGSDTDEAVFETALVVGRAFRAHLEFFHVRVDPAEALRYQPHSSFARRKGLQNALHELREEAETRSEAGRRHFHEFCKRHKIKLTNEPGRSQTVSASWKEVSSDAEEPFVVRARVHDLVIIARATRPNGLPPDLLPLLLFRSGRPILIAENKPRDLLGTVMICWKHTREAARAITAAMSLLNQAKRIVVTTIDEGNASTSDAAAVAHQLAWHGICAKTQTIKADGQPIVSQLLSAANDCAANLLVMGGYGTGMLRQRIFGGCTQSVLEHANVPVFIAH